METKNLFILERIVDGKLESYICNRNDFSWYKECEVTGKHCDECGCCMLDDGDIIHAEILAAKDYKNGVCEYIPIASRVGDIDLDYEFEYKISDNSDKIIEEQFNNYLAFKKIRSNNCPEEYGPSASFNNSFEYKDPYWDAFYITEIIIFPIDDTFYPITPSFDDFDNRLTKREIIEDELIKGYYDESIDYEELEEIIEIIIDFINKDKSITKNYEIVAKTIEIMETALEPERYHQKPVYEIIYKHYNTYHNGK